MANHTRTGRTTRCRASAPVHSTVSTGSYLRITTIYGIPWAGGGAHRASMELQGLHNRDNKEQWHLCTVGSVSPIGNTNSWQLILLRLVSTVYSLLREHRLFPSFSRSFTANFQRNLCFLDLFAPHGYLNRSQ